MRRIILDTDPGIDDALAMLLIAASAEIKLEAITVVHGNTTVDKCGANALKVLDLLNLNTPVYLGSPEPLVKQLGVAEETHGDTGLGYAVLPPSNRSFENEKAFEALIRIVNENPGEITILAIAPLTNIALAILTNPDFRKNVKELVIMGGAVMYPGNATYASEYNIFSDPESLDIVLRSGIKITLVPLDVTYQCIFTTEHLAKISDKNSKIKAFIADSTRFYMEFHEEYQDIKGCAINDPLAAAILVKPELCEYGDFYIEVELKDSLSRAQTLIDYFNISKQKSNVKLATKVNVPDFMEFFIERVNTL